MSNTSPSVGSTVSYTVTLHNIGINTDTYTMSATSGFPVAFYGVVGYLAVLIVALLALRPAALAERKWNVVLTGLATAGLLFTAYLTYLELFVIHAICRWCVGSAIVITLIWIVALTALRRPLAAPSPPPNSPAPRTDPGASRPLRDPPA